MNHEIKFRGLTKKGQWVYGSYIHCEIDGDSIKPFDRLDNFEVLSETIGQYTGLKDKNGKHDYFGDIVRDDDGNIGEVIWDEKALRVAFKWTDGKITYPAMYYDYIGFEVIGNIHQNKELLEAQP